MQPAVCPTWWVDLLKRGLHVTLIERFDAPITRFQDMQIARTGLSERDDTVIEFDGRRVLSDRPIDQLHVGHLS